MTSDVLMPPPVRRRRTSAAADPLKKVTVHLHESVSTAITRAVNEGAATSQGAFIEAAVISHLRDLRRAKVYAAYADAAADPAFVTDMVATTAAFDGAVGDGLGA